MNYAWLVYSHLAAVFLFLLVHGVPVGVALKLRWERDPARVRALLELSWNSVGLTHLAMFLVLGTGVALAIQNRVWGQPWVTSSLVLFVLFWAAMFLFGTRHYDRVRRAVGAREFYPKKGAAATPLATPEELEALLGTHRPFALSAIGLVALGVFLWLMRSRPALW